MNRSVKVLDIELQHPLEDLSGLSGYGQAQGLLRFAGKPLGYVTIPLTNGFCPATTIYSAIIDQHSAALAKCIILDALVRTHDVERRPMPQASSRSRYAGSWPVVTVAVCTRDRAPLLADCLASLTRLAYPALDLLVIDNAPTTPATATLVHSHFPTVRYLHEPRPGLNWARNRAIAEARGELLAFTDDDARVDPHWVQALAQAFALSPDVMAVTGLVVPAELDTQAQILFERYGGFGRGFARQVYHIDQANQERTATHYGGAGKFGTGANMAYRRALFTRIGGFDPALDVGTITHGGGDLEMFFRVLHAGYTLVYEPSAIVRHRHRRDYAELRQQITDFGIGFYSYLMRTALAYPRLRFTIVRLALRWLWRRNVRRLLLSLMRPWPFPRDLIMAELEGSLRGLGRYPKARRTAVAIARAYALGTMNKDST